MDSVVAAVATAGVAVAIGVDGVATVEGAAATLIQHQAPDILARVNLVLGEGAVERLRIVQGPLRGVSSARPRPASRSAPPLDAPLDAAVEQALAKEMAAVPEGPLRAALTRLGRAVRRRGSG